MMLIPNIIKKIVDVFFEGKRILDVENYG